VPQEFFENRATYDVNAICGDTRAYVIEAHDVVDRYDCVRGVHAGVLDVELHLGTGGLGEAMNDICVTQDISKGLLAASDLFERKDDEVEAFRIMGRDLAGPSAQHPVHGIGDQDHQRFVDAFDAG
jgi:hypothetical protein